MCDKKRILLVEGDHDLTQLMKLGFEKEGFEVDTASNGLMGLNKARDEMPGLIIMDVMVPTLDGYHVCRFLKFDQKYMHIPIVMIVGKAQESEAQTSIEAGANEYIYKPIDINKLIAMVRHYIV